MVVRNLLLIAVLAAFQTQSAYSHSGGTNADGCHTNRKTGDYHCHNPKPEAASGAVTYCHVVSGEKRCGYSRSTCNNLVSTYGGSCRQE
jgi:hypothetical protein